MDSPASDPRPIGWTELIAGASALLFGVAAAWALAASLAGARGGAASAAGSGASVAEVYRSGSCLSLPSLGGMRLGTARAYPEAGIRLDPAPFDIQPVISAADAYSRAADNPTGCQTQQLLAYYSSTIPPADHVLAWVVVATTSCDSHLCMTVSPVDATTGRVLPSRSFTEPTRP
jgi:hypothetical protein